MEFYVVVSVVAVFVSFLLLCTNKKRIFSFIRFLYLTYKIPGPTLWQLATIHARHMLSDGMITYAWKLCESHNYKPWGTWMADGTYAIIVSDCETISALYKSKSTTDKSDLFYKQVAQVVGRNIFTMNGPDYPRYRKMFANGLRKSLQDCFLPRISRCMSEFVEALREKAAGGSDVNLRSLIEWHMMVSTIASYTSVSHTNASRKLQFSWECLSRRMEIIQTQAMNPVYYWFLRLKTSTRQNMALCKTGLGALDDILMYEKSRVLCAEDSDDARDILQIFVQTYLKLALDEGSDNVLCWQGRQLFIASVETTAFVVNVLLLILALHQDVQQRVCDEADLVLGKNERPILVDDLEKMEYMEMVIKETLRLFPAGPMLARSVREETQLNGILAPAGSTIVINAMALQRNPEYFRNPLKFDPNRFLPEASKDIRPYTYIPFSAGFRNCPGQAHAFAMIKLFLCHVVRNFRILPGEKLKSLDDIKIKLCVTLHLQESSLRLVDRH